MPRLTNTTKLRRAAAKAAESMTTALELLAELAPGSDALAQARALSEQADMFKTVAEGLDLDGGSPTPSSKRSSKPKKADPKMEIGPGTTVKLTDEHRTTTYAALPGELVGGTWVVYEVRGGTVVTEGASPFCLPVEHLEVVLPEETGEGGAS